MKRYLQPLALLLRLASLGGCNKHANDQDAIRASIEKRLNARSDLNLSAMDREIKQISVNGDHATAQVEFRLKDGQANMDIEYTLQRQGNDWTVLSGVPMGGGQFMGGPGPAPDPGGSPLPPGHPGQN